MSSRHIQRCQQWYGFSRIASQVKTGGFSGRVTNIDFSALRMYKHHFDSLPEQPHRANRPARRSPADHPPSPDTLGRRSSHLGQHRKSESVARLVTADFARRRFAPDDSVVSGKPPTRSTTKSGWRHTRVQGGVTITVYDQRVFGFAFCCRFGFLADSDA
jgi:hypothetical protein